MIPPGPRGGSQARALRWSARRLGVGSVLRHPISQNAIVLYGVQFVLTLVPLVTLPWMAAALGPTELGLVLFTQAFSFLVGMLIEYGFGLSGTRRIAQERDDPRAMAATVAAVQTAKLALVGAAAAVALVALVAVAEFRQDPRLLVFGWAMAALAGLNPFWFFTGLERLRLVGLVDVSSRLLMAAAIVVFVREPGDGILVLWIWTIGSAVSLAVLSIMMYRQIPLRLARLTAGRAALREAWPLFLTTASVSLYTSGTVFMLGLVTSSARLAVFAAAERIARVAVRAIGPVASAAYPRVSHLLSVERTDRAQQLSFLVLVALTGLGVVSAALLYVLAPTIVDLVFDERFEDTAGLVRVIALILPSVAVASTLSALWLLARGLDRIPTRLALIGGLSNVVLTPLVGTLAGPLGVAWVVVGIETSLAIAFVLVVRAKGLTPTRAQILGR